MIVAFDQFRYFESTTSSEMKKSFSPLVVLQVEMPERTN